MRRLPPGTPFDLLQERELLHELRHARIALIGIARHRLGEHHIHGLDQRVTRSHRRVFAVEDGPQGQYPLGRPERMAPGDHLVDDDCQAEDVGPLVDLTPGELLRRHVFQGAEHVA